MSNTINSHIQNSRFLINEFRISQTDGQVHILNLNDYTFSRKGPRELGTELRYFDDDTEKYLSTKYEGPLSVLLSKIKADNARLMYRNLLCFLTLTMKYQKVKKNFFSINCI